MGRVEVEDEDGFESEDEEHEDEAGARGRRRRRRRSTSHVEVQIEREITYRRLVESITSVVIVVLYMGFTLLREREAGVVVLDPDDDPGPEDDWQE